MYSTYLGGSANDFGNGIAVDQAGNAYVTGYTWSTDFPTQNAYDSSYNVYVDVFVTKLSPAGNALVYSTYLGGSWGDAGYGIAVDQAGSTYVTGETGSTDFPTQNPYDGSYNGVADAFVTKLSPTGNALVYSTYLGGSSDDIGVGIAVDEAGSAHVTGYTGSADFPTQNPYDGSFNGSADVFVTKLSAEPPTSPHISLDPTTLVFDAVQNGPLPPPQTRTISNTGGGVLDWSVTADQPWLDVAPTAGQSNSQVVQISVNTTALPPGTHSATITIASNNADNSPQTVSISYQIQSLPHISLSPPTLTFSAPSNVLLPPSQTFTITNTGGGTLDWSVSDDASWLDETPPSGSDNQSITVSINTTNLAPATYNAIITIGSSNADNPGQAVAVSYVVQSFPQFLGEKKQLVTDILNTPHPWPGNTSRFFDDAETQAGAFVDQVEAAYQSGTADPLDLEGVARLTLSERVTKQALNDAIIIADYGAKGFKSIVTTLVLSGAFKWLAENVKIIPLFGGAASGKLNEWARMIDDGTRKLVMAFQNGGTPPMGQLTIPQYTAAETAISKAYVSGSVAVTKKVASSLDAGSFGTGLFQEAEDLIQDYVFLGPFQMYTNDKQLEAVNRAKGHVFQSPLFPTAEADATATLNEVTAWDNAVKDGARWVHAIGEAATWETIIGMIFLLIVAIASAIFTGGSTLLLVLASAGVVFIQLGSAVSKTAAIVEAGGAGYYNGGILPILFVNPSVDQAFGPTLTPTITVVPVSCMAGGSGRDLPRRSSAVRTVTDYFTRLRTRILDNDSTWATTGIDSLTFYESLLQWEEEITLADFLAVGDTARRSIGVYDSLVQNYAANAAAREFLSVGLRTSAFVFSHGYREPAVSVDAIAAIDSSSKTVANEGAARSSTYDSIGIHSLSIPTSVGISRVSGTMVAPYVASLAFTVVNYGTALAESVIVYPVLVNGATGFIGAAADTVDISAGDSANVIFRLDLSEPLLAGTLITAPGKLPAPYYTLPPRDFQVAFSSICNCPHQGDLMQNGVIDVNDVLAVIKVAFLNGADIKDPLCPKTRGDVNNSGTVDVNDVLYIIRTAFMNGPNPVNPCGP